MKLIIIQGGGASGKSTLAKELSKSLDIPAFFKDKYKESIYDKVGKKLGLVKWLKVEEQSYDKIYSVIKSSIDDQKSIIVEGNFLPHRRGNLKEAIRGYPGVIEIDCHARGWVTLKRYIERNENGARHKGHRDRLWYGLVFLEALFNELGLAWYRPLRLSGNLMKVDTSYPAKIDYDEIVEFVNTST